MFHVLIFTSLIIPVKTLKQAILLFYDDLMIMIVAVMIMTQTLQLPKAIQCCQNIIPIIGCSPYCVIFFFITEGAFILSLSISYLFTLINVYNDTFTIFSKPNIIK